MRRRLTGVTALNFHVGWRSRHPFNFLLNPRVEQHLRVLAGWGSANVGAL